MQLNRVGWNKCFYRPPDLEPENWEYESNLCYELWLHECWRYKNGHRSNTPDGYGTYMPGPQEIKRRCGDLKWLTNLGFPEEFLKMVMRDSNPTIEEVVHQVTVRKVPPKKLLQFYAL